VRCFNQKHLEIGGFEVVGVHPGGHMCPHNAHGRRVRYCDHGVHPPRLSSRTTFSLPPSVRPSCLLLRLLLLCSCSLLCCLLCTLAACATCSLYMCSLCSSLCCVLSLLLFADACSSKHLTTHFRAALHASGHLNRHSLGSALGVPWRSVHNNTFNTSCKMHSFS